MADTVVNYGQTKEQVALRLAELVARAEGKVLGNANSAKEGGADRQYILSTYHQCFEVVCGVKPKP